MTKILRNFLALAALAAASLPATGQTLLLDVNTSVPLAAVLDNPCTSQAEAIAFSGSTALQQRVYLMPDGRFRLQFAESTTLSGTDTLVALNPLAPPVPYTVASTGQQDIEIDPWDIEILQFKKVARTGSDDNFHSILVLAFDPLNLRFQVGLEAACDNGQP
jgi:hypothetical protein